MLSISDWKARAMRTAGSRAMAGGILPICPQHQVLHVRSRDPHALLLVEPPLAADVEAPLDLLVDPADRLHLAPLVDGAGDGERLADGLLRQRREQRIELGGR